MPARTQGPPCQTFTAFNRLVVYTDTEPRTELYLVGEPGGVLAGEAAGRGRHAVCHHGTEDYTGRGSLQNDTSQPLQYHSESCYIRLYSFDRPMKQLSDLCTASCSGSQSVSSKEVFHAFKLK